MYSAYYGEVSDYTRKSGVFHSEILLPPHAPPEYADRQTLWNAVEKTEAHPKAQLAYSFDIALQNEFSLEENIALARQFLSEQFVSRGMICDFAVHQPDANGGIENPHFHVMCPIRPLDENGKWSAKQRRVYRLDEDGTRIIDQNGKPLFDAVPTTDWGSPETLERWRRSWAELCNAKFAEKNLDVRIDHRSYKRQDVEQLPTVHEGVAVRQMEARGIRTDKGALNRWIQKTNALLKKIKAKIAEITRWIAEHDEKLREMQTPSIAELLGKYYNNRNVGAYSQKAKVGNVKRYAADVEFLMERGITSMDELRKFVSDMSSRYHDANRLHRRKSERVKELKTLLRLAQDYARLKPVFDAIPAKNGFRKMREKYLFEHDREIEQFYVVRRKLNEAVPDKRLKNTVWQAELDELSQQYAAESAALHSMYKEMEKLQKIGYRVDTVLHNRQREPQQKSHEQER